MSLRAIELKTAESVYRQGNILVNSGYLTPCIGIFVYHPRTQRVFAGHFPSSDDGMLEKFVRRAARRFRDDSRDTIVYLAGNSRSRFGPDDVDPRQERDHVLRLLHAKGLDGGEIVARWSPLETTAYATLDLRTGEADLVLQTEESLRSDEPDIFYRGPFRKALVYAPDWNPNGERR